MYSILRPACRRQMAQFSPIQSRKISQLSTSCIHPRFQRASNALPQPPVQHISQKQYFSLFSRQRQQQEPKASHASSKISPHAPNPTSPTKPLAIPTTRHENIYTLPNALTATRLIAAPAVGYFILTSQPILAASLFIYAGITDAIDGYLARHYSSQTVLGTILDPMADKLLMTITVASLAATSPALMPLYLAVIILGRDVALAISALWWRWISLPEPKTLSRYWDFSLPSAEVRPTEISKINTLLQLVYVAGAMVVPVLPEGMVAMGNLGGVLEGWGYLVATTTVWSGLSYVFTKDAVRVLSKEDVRKVEEERKAEAKKL